VTAGEAEPRAYNRRVDALDRAQTLIADFTAATRAELPDGAVLFDAHTHLGHDIDGMVGDFDQLTGLLREHGFGGAFMFCLNEHDREPDFRAANDRTLEAARRSNGLLTPFVRLDLGGDPVNEALRCLDLGAAGIKLHPRAQSFSIGDDRLTPIFALATERDVPILVHGGRGLPPIAEDLTALVERHEGVRLIVAHAGIADMAALAGRLGGVPGVYFDTSVWSGIDLLDLFHQVAPEQVVYASDYPYGRQPNSLLLTIRTARVSGFGDDALRRVLGGSALDIIHRRPVPMLSSPRGSAMLTQPMAFARIHQYLAMTTPLFWLAQGDVLGALGLAVNASLERDGFPDESEQIHELLATAQEVWTYSLAIEDAVDRRRVSRVALGLVHLADMLAVTTRA
jgi:predicted TIM-barrel fold metal-dependent hydrolase